ncbi:protein arginine methyltransferase NDUFAF7 homolog, mitochondrial [Trichogramma pretiosum]|uniref:protein arginine methyltransferase NDUFAF7 homolog, mitochondrial n=1 Tax=Trichogramma pretiosum TaxID=7493 RepID=UPI0006C9AB77|nr:protein arginine methyltransferase NDUFAF7 homolog, mitochondrial [Trichogramma pretiosum]
MNNNNVKVLGQKLLSYSRLRWRVKNASSFMTTAADRSTVEQCQQTNSVNQKSDLCKDLQYKIKLSGPLSVAGYMKHVLTHPAKGYYINKDVLGPEGDFVTSPELSQLFGEMIAVWIISECKKIHNKKFQIVELGPGRGTLSRDILRVFDKLKMNEEVSLHLVEVSQALAKVQKDMLCGSESSSEDSKESKGKHYMKGKTSNGIDVYWYKSVIDLPQGFSIFIAQEFFDALPIHKFQKTTDGWFEVMVDVDASNEQEDKFKFVLAKTEACDAILDKNDPRDHVEISLEAMNVIRYTSTAIAQNGGFMLIIDYGHSGEKTDTFRAFRQHKQVDPLVEPGLSDLTADVDFALLKRIARYHNNTLCFGPVTQKDFLTELGINIRLANLCKNATPAQRKQLEHGYNKIVGDDEMGTCFKVVAMFPNVLKDHFKKFPVYGFNTYNEDDLK